jgi:hypothetical protein
MGFRHVPELLRGRYPEARAGSTAPAERARLHAP